MNNPQQAKHLFSPSMVLLIRIAFLMLFSACASSTNYKDPFSYPQIQWRPSIQLTVTDANNILGNPSRLEKTTAYLEDKIMTYQSAFRDDWLDPVSGKTGILYYMYEEYPDAESAQSSLDAILTSNAVDKQSSLKTPNGARLFYLTGGDVTRMVMIIKEKKLLRVKVNQVTSRYRLSEFQRISTKLAKAL